MAGFTLIVSTRAMEGQEAALDRWYDEVHLAEVLGLDGFTSAHRLRRTGAGDTARSNLAVYGIEAVDEAAAEETLERLKAASLTPTDALDPTSVIFDLYRNGAAGAGGGDAA